MNKEDIRKRDWKLFQTFLPQWQEKYMEKLLKDYSLLINDSSYLPSYRFHELEKRIQKDKRKPGVFVTLNKNEMENIVSELIMENAISEEDLKGFSNDFQNEVKKLLVR